MKQEKEVRFQEVIAENRDKIFRVCYAYLYDKNEVEDLYQEILINIWQYLDGFRGEAKLSTWIYRISANTALLFNRHTRKKRKVFAEKASLKFDLAEDQSLGDKIALDQSLDQLAHAISLLKEQDRLLLSLLLEGLSYQEIAGILGITINHVGVKINRSKERLRKKMKELNYGL